MSMGREKYKFTFNDADANGAAEGVGDLALRLSEIEYKRGRTVEKVKYGTGTLEVTAAEAGQATEVTQTKVGRGSIETKIYSDADLDGLFAETFEIEVKTNSVRIEQHKFTITADGAVTADYELGQRGWKLDRKDWNESYQAFDTDNDGTFEYVVKVEQERGGQEFEIFRDDNGDGIYAQIAEGETVGTFTFDPNSTYLDPADVIIG